MRLRLPVLPPAAEEVVQALGRASGGWVKAPDRVVALAGQAAHRATELVEPQAAVGPLTAGTWPEGFSGVAAQAVVVTLGEALEAEVRRLFGAGRATEGLLLDAAGNLLLGGATAEACRRLGGTWLAPGCHGLPLSLLPALVAAAGGEEAGVGASPGGMLRPEKSVAGLVVQGAGGWRPAACAGCASPICPWRGGGRR